MSVLQWFQNHHYHLSLCIMHRRLATRLLLTLTAFASLTMGGVSTSVEPAGKSEPSPPTPSPTTATLALKPHPAALPGIHAPGEVDRPEMVPFIVSDPAKLPGIVVDETSATLEGEWQYSTHTPPYVGLGYIHDMKTGKGKKSVTFSPDLPKAGWYEVRLAHCYNLRRATNTPVTIHHAEGEKQMRINQQEEPEHGKLFRTLGVFRFEAGRNGWVRVSNEGSDVGKVVIADAVQFLPVPAPKVSP
jgi:hypothetical protein